MVNGIQVGLDINAYSIFVCVVLHILYTKKILTHQKNAVIRRNLRYLFFCFERIIILWSGVRIPSPLPKFKPGLPGFNFGIVAKDEAPWVRRDS